MKIAVVLSGCGVRDGAEIHESVLALLAIKQHNAEYVCFAPNIPQKVTIDHATGKETQEKRSVLSEAGRIARGEIQPLEKLDPEAFNGVFLPGGYGVALNLSNYADKNVECEVDPILKKCILQFHQLKKPIGASCLAPILLAKIFQGVASIKMTMGTAQEPIKELKALGMQPVSSKADEVVSDDANKVYTTPAYMEQTDIAHIYKGISQVIQKVVSNAEFKYLCY